MRPGIWLGSGKQRNKKTKKKKNESIFHLPSRVEGRQRDTVKRLTMRLLEIVLGVHRVD